MVRLAALAAALVVSLAPAALAQPVGPGPSDPYAATRAALAEVASPLSDLAAGDPARPPAMVAIVVPGDPETVDRVFQIGIAAAGLVLGTAAAVVAWPIVFAENEGAARGEPVAQVADVFRYGFVLPVAVGATALAGYSGVRFVRLVF